MIALRICDLESNEGKVKSCADDSDNDEEIECSADEIEFSAGVEEIVKDLILTDSLADHLTDRVLLLAVNRAYEGIGDDVGVRSILELFIYVQFFERSDFFYTFSSLNVIGLMRLVPIERKQSRHGRHLKTTELTVQISIGKEVINSKLAERVFIPPLG